MTIKPKYDFLIVGAGLYGSVFAHEATKAGKKCLVIDKREHLGGNVYCKNIEGINVHQYGPHIFHTNDKKIWDYVNSFVDFNRFTNSPLVKYKEETYNLPFNMNTFKQMWGVDTPAEAESIINDQTSSVTVKPRNLEEFALSQVGTDIYEKLIKGYTTKQWGRSCSDLPVSIINRIPIRYTYNNNYYDDTYQGIPIGGYNKLIDGLLDGVETELSVDYFNVKTDEKYSASTIVYTGKIDQYFSYKYGRLDYRTVSFEHQVLDIPNFQGNAIVNYADKEIPFTRIIEHKHFEFGTQPKTVISKEFPKEASDNDEPHYPINDKKNNDRYLLYKDLSEDENNVIFGGRLAEYKYYDMHQVIASSLKTVKKLI
ncbi:MAG: UDP-galactopyranose mutase [Bacteroidetes bacterium]|nr:MAG: UDP-galactopyranose mutase [Bacteroidota bacterium]